MSKSIPQKENKMKIKMHSNYIITPKLTTEQTDIAYFYDLVVVHRNTTSIIIGKRKHLCEFMRLWL